ncbi:MAG: aldo/keto reductase [Dehalococcoidales bacterium]|nr:aldo/keto reductase [Dehalococcoidales bacterium]
MEYRNLGGSGLKVSEIGLGGNTFGPRADEPTSIAIINHAVDIGINYIDTADMYGRGSSEELVGKAVKGKRSRVVIATKFGREMGDGPNQRGAARYYIMKAVDASLKRLQTDYIDLYQIHLPDPATPIEETLRTLDDLVRAGKVRYTGCSNFAAWQLCEAIWVSRLHNLEHFITVQPRYNLLDRTIEAELVPCCRAYNIGVIPWGPLAGGFLTGKYRQGEAAPPDARLVRPMALYGEVFTGTNWSKLAKLETFAAERGHTVGELAISWLLSKPWVSSIIAGAKTVEQVSANAAPADWKLTAEEMADVEAICPVE